MIEPTTSALTAAEAADELAALAELAPCLACSRPAALSRSSPLFAVHGACLEEHPELLVELTAAMQSLIAERGDAVLNDAAILRELWHAAAELVRIARDRAEEEDRT